MEFSAFKAQIEAARKTEASIGGATFHLLLPSDHAWRIALESNRDAQGRVIEAQAFRSILNAALTGWEGVTTRDLLPDAPEETLPFSARARAELLDLRQDIADELTVVLGLKLAERRAQRETARKN